ncbi:phosphatidylglycerophosphatase A family protein [Hymenobacter volaticus]|uniref:Phosphatidylglycerophosphatase A n=1 Tax=Hymenobacter volaticus TaxID=2932254 RepID=A0ABY4GCN2_9BACT|nr:phosphatidylglycerophosphatase A [Hymenobacter volaticus]UOQ68652.1 phosphatidylglycerophosphatase A [Hymenobacter volaticus]
MRLASGSKTERSACKVIASVLGIGYVKGGGTVAAIACCLLLYPMRTWCLTQHFLPVALLTVGLLVLGTWAAHQVEPLWGKDNYRVVIDEVAGMWISVLFVPLTGPRLLAGLVLFRFFDITKPLFIRRMEKLPGGVGVMMDDVLAGVYANVLLQAGIYFRFF